MAEELASEEWRGTRADVEPWREERVVSMGHPIEDPTFDDILQAVNPRAKCRPVHRPPRASSSGRSRSGVESDE